jgi:hypothetical protein
LSAPQLRTAAPDTAAGRLPRRRIGLISTDNASVMLKWLVEDPATESETDDAMEFPTVDTSDVLLRATRLSMDTGHHVFDTLYHSVALEHGATMPVTVD